MLFDITENKTESSFSGSFVPINHPADFISSQDDYLSNHLKHINWLQGDKMYHFTSNGRYALHDLIIHLAGKLESPDCIVTSFNLSVLAAKAFSRAWDKRTFKSIRLVLNAQKKSNFIDAIKLLEGKFPMSFAKIHAKVGLIWNREYYFTIVTTGNLSSNNNIERGFVSTSKKIFDYDKQWISSLF